MPSSTLAPSSKPLSGRYLTFADREEIALARAQGVGVREIARRLGRTASTVSPELRRNAATRSGGLDYRASTAQWHAEIGAPAKACKASNQRGATGLRTGSAGRPGRRSRRSCGLRAGRTMEGAPVWQPEDRTRRWSVRDAPGRENGSLRFPRRFLQSAEVALSTRLRHAKSEGTDRNSRVGKPVSTKTGEGQPGPAPHLRQSPCSGGAFSR